MKEIFTVFSSLGIILSVIKNADSKGFLTVIAPKSIQANSEYRFSISAVDILEPINVGVKLTYYADQQAAKTIGVVKPELISIPDPSDLYCQSCGQNELYVNRQPLPDSISKESNITVTWEMQNNVKLCSAEKSKTVVFQINDILLGSYVLEVTSLSSSLEFSEKIFLYRESYTFSMLIETDKPVYKPGDIIKFRVLVLDSKTQPIHVEEALTVAVSDATQNRVQIWNNVSTSQGIYNNDYEIEAKNDINLGLWQVEVEYKDKLIKKTVEVAEYVLPKFKVEVETSNCMHVRVKATYFNGKPVAGSATIKTTPIFSCSGSWKKMVEPVIKTVNCVGHTDLVFKKSDFVNQNFVMLLIEVSVQEKTTGALVQGSDVIIPIENTNSITNGQHGKLLQIKLINQPNLHKNIKIEVTTKEKLSNLFYYVVGRGRILLSKEVKGHDLQKKFIVIKPTSVMAPESQLVVYYISDNGAIISDVVKLMFADQISNNFIELKVCNNKLKPGENVQIKIKTKPNSFVGLLAVDVRSKFKAGNDLTRDRIIQELKNYENFGQIHNETTLTKSVTQMVELGTFVVTNSNINERTSEHIVYEEFTQIPKFNRKHKTDKDSAESEEDSRSHQDKIYSKRSFFPETWLWQDIKTHNKEVTVLTTKVPDSITTWQLTAFSINEHGLALTEQPIMLAVSQNFYVSISLPYSALRGEKLDISVSVHNYFEVSTHVKLKLHNKNNDFEILQPGNFQTLQSDQHVVSTSFTIIPNRVGQITVEVTASSSDHDCDTVRRVLLIEPEGITFRQQKQFTIVVNNNQSSFKHDLKIPENIVQDSLSTSLSVKGDTSSVVLNNLEQFSQTISGDESSLLLNFKAYSNMLLSYYLKVTRQANDTVNELLEDSRKNYALQINKQCWDGGFGDSKYCHKKKCKKVRRHRGHKKQCKKVSKHRGRQARLSEFRELPFYSEEHKLVYKQHGHHHSSEEHEHCVDECNFCCKNNYHSCSRNSRVSKPVSSTLLTSQVCINMLFYSYFFISPDKNVINRAVKFLSQVQACNGSFTEYDKSTVPKYKNTVIFSTVILQVMVYLARKKLLIQDYNCTLNRGLEYLSQELDNTDDVETLSRISTAFWITNHPKKFIAKQRMDLKRSKLKGSLVWLDPFTGNVDTTATGTAMFATLIAGDIPGSINIAKGLSNSIASDSQLVTNSTIPDANSFSVLGNVAEAVVPVDPNIKIFLTSEQNYEKSVQLNKENRYLVQKLKLPSCLQNFTVSGNGTGLASFLVSSQYNLPISTLSEQFTLALNLLPSFEKGWTLQVCASFKPIGNMTQSKRATLEIDIPVGCAVSDNILTVERSSKIKAFDLAEGDRLLKVQVEDLSSENFCFDVQFKRVVCVAIPSPSKVIIFDNDQTTYFAQQLYHQPLDDTVYIGN